MCYFLEGDEMIIPTNPQTHPSLGKQTFASLFYKIRIELIYIHCDSRCHTAYIKRVLWNFMQIHGWCIYYCAPQKTTPCVPGAKENTRVLSVIQRKSPQPCTFHSPVLWACETDFEWLIGKRTGWEWACWRFIFIRNFYRLSSVLGALSTFTHNVFTTAL